MSTHQSTDHEARYMEQRAANNHPLPWLNPHQAGPAIRTDELISFVLQHIYNIAWISVLQYLLVTLQGSWHSTRMCKDVQG